MPGGSGVLAGLALLGRWGTQAFIASVVIGLALPWLASAARPLLPWTVFVFLTLMFARVDLGDVRRLARRPAVFGLACIWLLAAPPALFGAILGLVGRSSLDPGLMLGLALQAAAPPLTSAPAIAMLFGINPALILSAVLATTVVSAFTAPILADWVAGAAVPLDILLLARRLLLLIAGSMAAAAIVRLGLGPARLARHAKSLDGLSVCFYVLFGVAAMDGVLAATLDDPARSLRFTAISFMIAGAGFLAAWAALWPLLPRDRLVVGYATGQRNAALLIAALGASTPDATFLYFALSQLPIFILPQLIRPLARRAVLASPDGQPAPPA